jgi:Ca-activated chloride channel family protein
LLIVALAQPRLPETASAERQSRRAASVVLDVSGSMGTVETVADRPTTRLDFAKQLLRRLLLSPVDESLRPGEEVGLIALSQAPRVMSPLTREHRLLLQLADGLDVDQLDNRTNLGDALALAVDQTRRRPASERVVLLISDGAHNVPTGMPPAEAARIAEALGVIIHVVGVGSKERAQDAAAFERDQRSLEQIAGITGGVYLHAARAGDLERMIERLNQLAPPQSEVVAYRRWREAYPVFIVAALACFLAELLLRKTVLRILPAN